MKEPKREGLSSQFEGCFICGQAFCDPISCLEQLRINRWCDFQRDSEDEEDGDGEQGKQDRHSELGRAEGPR